MHNSGSCALLIAMKLDAKSILLLLNHLRIQAFPQRKYGVLNDRQFAPLNGWSCPSYFFRVSLSKLLNDNLFPRDLMHRPKGKPGIKPPRFNRSFREQLLFDLFGDAAELRLFVSDLVLQVVYLLQVCLSDYSYGLYGHS